MNTCVLCSKVDARAVCSKCRTVYYCSRKCQTSDWERHKPKCQQITKKKYFLKSSWMLSEIKCGYGCCCDECMVDVEPFKVLLSYQSGNLTQKVYLEKMLKIACEEIKDSKFEFVVVDRTVATCPQIEACDVLISDMSPMGEVSSLSDFLYPDQVVVRESKFGGRTSCIIFNSALCCGKSSGPGQVSGLVEFHADERALEQSQPNRPFIRDIQALLMNHVEVGFQHLLNMLSQLSPSLVFGLIRTVTHPTFDDKKFPYIVVYARLCDASKCNAEDILDLIQSSQFCHFGHFPSAITTPHVVFHRSECSEEVCFRLSTQMIKYYWTEAAVKDIPPAEPMQFYAVRSTKKSSEAVMFDENVLFLFPKTGNEDFDMPGMGGCAKRGDFTRVPIF